MYPHAWSTPLPYVYIHRQLHRSVTDSVNHIQLPLMALTWVNKILINVFRQSRCQTRVKVFVIFYNGDDRNDRNDKESEKSYVRAIARGLWISCHSCHLCNGETSLIWPMDEPVGCVGSMCMGSAIDGVILLVSETLMTAFTCRCHFNKTLLY